MQKIATRIELIDLLDMILTLEKKARDSYEKDAYICSRPELSMPLLSIKDDEDKHIGILETLIRVLKK